MQRITAHFAGRVQGVGFRYTTSRVARGYAVAGYVMNLPDGRVELVAEGESKEVKAFVEAVNAEMSRNIRELQTDTAEANGEFGDPASPNTFGIRH